MDNFLTVLGMVILCDMILDATLIALFFVFKKRILSFARFQVPELLGLNARFETVHERIDFLRDKVYDNEPETDDCCDDCECCCDDCGQESDEE